MVVAGHEERSEADHAVRVMNMAVDMIEAAKSITMPNGQPLRIRVGVHSGPAFAGVIGEKMPRFCFFGDTINISSRMESTGLPLLIQASTEAHDCYWRQRQLMTHLPAQAVLKFLNRGEVPVKGKGDMQTFLFDGSAQPSLPASDAAISA